MSRLIKLRKKIFPTYQERVADYLSRASDLCDLERRIIDLQRNGKIV